MAKSVDDHLDEIFKGVLFYRITRERIRRHLEEYGDAVRQEERERMERETKHPWRIIMEDGHKPFNPLEPTNFVYEVTMTVSSKKEAEHGGE